MEYVEGGTLREKLPFEKANEAIATAVQIGEALSAAHDAGIVVEPLCGPSALLLALAASGLNGQSFAFVGYLPSTPAERSQRIMSRTAAAARW